MKRKHYCIDIGSISSGKFGWYPNEEDHTSIQNYRSFEKLFESLKADLEKRKLSLGMETPIFYEVRSNPKELSQARWFDNGLSFAGGPGLIVSGTAILQMQLLFNRLSNELKFSVGFATSRENLLSNTSKDLLIWEAFVSSKTELRPKEIVPGHEVLFYNGSLSIPKHLQGKKAEHARDAYSALTALKLAEDAYGKTNEKAGHFHNYLGNLLYGMGLMDKSAIYEPCLVVMCTKSKA